MEIIIKTFHGLEDVLAKELQDLGISDITKSKRAVICEASWEKIYTLNLSLRTATRILIPVQRFNADNPDNLYQRARKIDWEEYLDADMDFRVDANVNSQKFKHSKYAGLKLKDAIVDTIRSKSGARPDVNLQNPDLRINLHINDNRCTISLDSSGDSLHKRGFKLRSVKAPINEILAAGIISLIEWDPIELLVDPMCGSGTFAIEAGLMALNLPPHRADKIFGFMNWKNFNARLWTKVKERQFSHKKDIDFQILCMDKDKYAIEAARENIKAAGLESYVKIKKLDFFSDGSAFDGGTIIMNPPYDERLELSNDLRFYKQIGDSLKSNYNNSVAWIFSANTEAIKHVGLKTSRRLHLYNGALPAKLHKFTLYEGSRKN